MKLQLEKRHAQMVWDIVKKYPDLQFYMFGSRVTGKARKFSDLDLFVTGPVEGATLFHVQDDFQESNLPFKVDVVHETRASQWFKDSIKKDLILVTKEHLGIKNE